MTGKVIDNSGNGILILILPLAFLIVLLFKAWLLLLTLLLLGMALKVWQHYQWQQWSRQVNPFFNQLIKENQGCLTPLDLSIKANLSGEAAKHFLEKKAEEFGAKRQELEEKGIVYYFLTASALGSIFDDSEPLMDLEDEPDVSDKPSLLESSNVQETIDKDVSPTELDENQEPLAEFSEQEKDPWEASSESEHSLIQAELARRLNVHSGTITKHKGDPDFSEWSKNRDPEGIAWEYSEEAKGFVPVGSN